MAKLIPLRYIPSSARNIESAWRRQFRSRDNALAAAEFRIEVAAGCHNRPYFAPPVIGWIGSYLAAEAYCQVKTRMPDNTSHHRRAYTYIKFDT